MVLSPTAQRWARLVSALEQSNLTAASFAARNNVNASTLSWWRSRLRGTTALQRFVDVALPAEAVGVSPPSALVVELVDRGVRVTVPYGTDLDWLRAVVESLS